MDVVHICVLKQQLSAVDMQMMNNSGGQGGSFANVGVEEAV